MGKSVHSREYILEMLSEYIKAERAVLTGKSYKIGTRGYRPPQYRRGLKLLGLVEKGGYFDIDHPNIEGD